MTYKDKTNPSIERHKARLNLSGDVYVVGHYIESLESHKRLFSTSKATTIEEAGQERVEYEAEQKRLRTEAAKEAEHGEPE